MSKPNYRVSLTFDGERKVFQARAPELEHCTAEGATRAEAIANLETEIDAQLANMLSHGSTPPKSVDEEVFSGELTAKVSKGLHKELVFQARSEGIELDQLVGELLAAASEGRKSTHRGPRSGNRAPMEQGDTNGNRGNNFDGPPRRQGGFGGRGNQAHLMDDRATFIEYVRGLDQGQGNAHGAGHRGPNPGGGGGGGGDRGRRRGGRSGGGGGGGGRGPGGYGGGGGGNGGYRNDSRGNGQVSQGPGMSSHAGPHPGSQQGRSPDGGQPSAPTQSAPAPAPSGNGGGGGSDSDGNS